VDHLRDVAGVSISHGDATHRWTFFTNHFFVLASVAADPDLRVRDIADLVGITERATQAILSDLVSDGCLARVRIGRRNRYQVDRSARLRHAMFSRTTVGQVLDAVLPSAQEAAAG
jgi:predicted transcriptional regulator of viral defense system